MAFTDIRHYLMTLPPAETVYYFPNPGNGGDALIASATFQLFGELGIRYQTIDLTEFDPARKIVVYGGGGNLVSLYSDASTFVAKCHQTAKRLIVFPHTIAGHEDLLKQLGSNVDIIAREATSHHHVITNSPGANVFIMDDLVFQLDVSRILSSVPEPNCYRTQPKRQLKSIVKTGLFKLRQLVKNPHDHHHEQKILNCFRADLERTDKRIPMNNIDLSHILNFGTDNEQAADYSSYRILTFLNQYQEIRTNRLHLCIAAALLGKKVKLYPGSYFKCEAVYEFSIKDRFENVQWMG